MDYYVRAESGNQLLARLDSRPRVSGLDEVIFGTGPEPNDIIEITGDPSSGKTLLLTQFLTKCLLPKKWQNVEIGGLNVGAIFLDTDHQFQVLKLASMMEAWILSKTESNSGGISASINSSAIEEIVKDALQNLTILSCYDNTQFMIAFHSLERILSANKNISIICIDSVSAFYWQNIMGVRGIRKMDIYLKNILQCLKVHVQKFKITIMYTKPSSFQSKGQESEERMQLDSGNTSKKLILQRIEGRDNVDSMFYVQILAHKEKKTFQYIIEDNGIKWVLT